MAAPGMGIKNVMVTGNLGYIGTVLTPMLSSLGYEVTGYDIEYYGGNCALFDAPWSIPGRQIIKDVRDAEKTDFENIDAVIHLAGLSNDPLGELNPEITDEINFRATVRLAECARNAGVKRFVFASSQSIYGISDVSREQNEDAEKNPLTAYAIAKWKSELELMKMASDAFIPTYFRPSTVYGASPRLRCDIVYNYFIACAFTCGKIEIKSDGTPWRPMIHVRDACSAFISALKAPAELIANQAFNIGIANGNYTVRELAEQAGKLVPGSQVVFTGEHGSDSRTYRVGFDKILTVLKDYYRPQWNLESGGIGLLEILKEIDFKEADFRGDRCVRLARLKKLLNENILTPDLRRKQSA